MNCARETEIAKAGRPAWRRVVLMACFALVSSVQATAAVEPDIQAWQRQMEAKLKTTQLQVEEVKYQYGIQDWNHRWLWMGLGGSSATLICILFILMGQQRARRKMRATDRQLGMMTFALDHVDEAAYMIDATKQRFIYVNEGACRALGYSRQELLEMKLQDIDPDASRQTQAQMKKDINHKGQLTLERLHRAKDGRVFPVEIFAALFAYAGQSIIICLVRDITLRKQTERELENSRTQLRGLAAHLEKAREQERKHIAREVHDELGQVLTALQLNVAALTHHAVASMPALCELSQDTTQLTSRALAVVRNVTASLRPVVLDMGIAHALEWEARRFTANTGIQCQVNTHGDEDDPEETHAITLFRIVQESLTNVSRHAHATQVFVDLERCDADYLLTVRDNGVGFDTRVSKTDSFGLLGIQERARMLGGTVRIDSHSGSGTTITVRLPALETEPQA